MSLTKDQALALLEPFWIAALSSRLRLEAMLDELPFTGSGEALKDAGELLQAGRYLDAKAQRFEPDYLLQAIQEPSGKVLLFPNVLLTQEDMETAQRRWMERHPELVKACEERRTAQAKRLEEAQARLQEKRRQMEGSAA